MNQKQIVYNWFIFVTWFYFILQKSDRFARKTPYQEFVYFVFLSLVLHINTKKKNTLNERILVLITPLLNSVLKIDLVRRGLILTSNLWCVSRSTYRISLRDINYSSLNRRRYNMQSEVLLNPIQFLFCSWKKIDNPLSKLIFMLIFVYFLHIDISVYDSIVLAIILDTYCSPVLYNFEAVFNCHHFSCSY